MNPSADTRLPKRPAERPLPAGLAPILSAGSLVLWQMRRPRIVRWQIWPTSPTGRVGLRRQCSPIGGVVAALGRWLGEHAEAGSQLFVYQAPDGQLRQALFRCWRGLGDRCHGYLVDAEVSLLHLSGPWQEVVELASDYLALVEPRTRRVGFENRRWLDLATPGSGTICFADGEHARFWSFVADAAKALQPLPPLQFEAVENGEVRWVEVRLRGTGHEGLVSVCATDVTQAHRREDALTHYVSELRTQQEQLVHFNAHLMSLAVTDGLTGLGNHRAFRDRLHSEIARARRRQEPLCLLLMDLDGFKAYNDQHGHPAGDTALQLVAHTIVSNIRASDYAARQGGEEFAVILPDAGTEAAYGVAERIRVAVKRDVSGLSLSAGIALLAARDDGTTLLSSADRALYASKHGGRDRTTVFDGESEPGG